MDKKVNMRILTIINGDYNVESKNYSYTDKEYKKRHTFFNSATNAKQALINYALKKGIVISPRELNYLCATCKNMLKCPKVMDSNKKTINKYPFIKTGIQVIYVDEEKRRKYKEFLDLQRASYESYDKYDEQDELIEQELKNGIRKVQMFQVYECDKYVDEYVRVPETRNNPIQKINVPFGYGNKRRK